MSDVTLKIAGRRYTFACAPGEEKHIAKLGSEIDARIADLPNVSRRSEAQSLLYAALLLADELDEARKTNTGSAKEDAEDAGALAGPLEELAERLEAIADELEEAADSA